MISFCKIEKKMLIEGVDSQMSYTVRFCDVPLSI